MGFKLNYITLSILWFSNFLIIAFFYTFDVDFKVTRAALINYIIVITIVYLVCMVIVLYNEKQRKQTIKKQIDVMLSDEYLIDEFKDDRLVNSIYSKLLKQKHNILMQNEEQNKWVHDIKIPLATLNLFIDNQREELDNDKIKTLELVALDIETSINKKIMFDKIELEIDDFKIEKFKLKPLIIEVIKKFRPSFMLKNIAIEIAVDDIIVLSDQKTIRYCLEQVISNAIKYSDDSTKILIYMLDDNTLCIEDTGSIINSQDINRLFEKGYTGVNSLDSGMASTGIGLYMVRKSLNYLNHTIEIESEYKTTKVLISFKNITKL